MQGRGPKDDNEATALFWLIQNNLLPKDWKESVEDYEKEIGHAAVKFHISLRISSN
jgi:hypothetical protein